MLISCLVPAPEHKTQFSWSRHKEVPKRPGCYALVTFDGHVLYVGLAKKSIQSRMESHLETPTKRIGTNLGVPFWFYYLERVALEVGPVERGWMNQAILEDGQMPPLNLVYSPL